MKAKRATRKTAIQPDLFGARGYGSRGFIGRKGIKPGPRPLGKRKMQRQFAETEILSFLFRNAQKAYRRAGSVCYIKNMTLRVGKKGIRHFGFLATQAPKGDFKLSIIEHSRVPGEKQASFNEVFKAFTQLYKLYG